LDVSGRQQWLIGTLMPAFFSTAACDHYIDGDKGTLLYRGTD